MKYQELAEVYEKLSSTTKRLEKIDILSDFLKKIKKDESYVLYLLIGNIYASYDERRIGISNQLAIKALSKSTGSNKDKIVSEWRKIGDLGLVAEKLTKSKSQHTLQSKSLDTSKVIENLRKLPELEGKGTIDKKMGLITELLTSADSLEAKYLIRTLLADLRMGVQESTIRESIAEAYFPKKKKESAEIVQRAIDKLNDIAVVFEIAKTKGIKGLETATLQIGKPIKAMLAQKVSTIEEGFKAMGSPCAVEWKYDGFRVIIHKNKDQVKIFTRMLENVTKQFPEIKDYVKKYVKGESFILDGEAVGYDKKTGRYTEFQSISQRIRRKYNIEELQKELPVEVNLFDILYHNGKSLLDKPLEYRTKFLRKIVTPKKYKIVTSKLIITSDVKKAEKFYKDALKDNQEGIMMKNLKADYKPGRMVGHMVKLKPEERDLDLVITGAEWGTGKRSGWLTSFILSCKHGNKYLEVGKVSTGLKEKSEMGISYENLTELIKPLIIKEKGRRVEIKPKIILSVTYQEIQKSPNYNSGLALRFPRFTALRPDKPLSELNTLKEIEQELTHQKKENYKYG